MISKEIRSIKPEIRVLGIDDGKFIPHTKGTVKIVGVVYRGGHYFEGIMHSKINIDGIDATQKIVNMIKGSPFYKELRIVFLDGITFGGFNVVDIYELYSKINLPVVSVVRIKPDFKKIRFALAKLPHFDLRWQIMEKAGKLIKYKNENMKNPIYLHVTGISFNNVKMIMKNTSTLSNIPEALRVAHIIASGLFNFKEKI